MRYLSTLLHLLLGDRWGDLYSDERHPGASVTRFIAHCICTSLILPKPPFFKVSVKGVSRAAGKLAEDDLERTCALHSEAMGLRPNSLSPQEIRLCGRVSSCLAGGLTVFSRERCAGEVTTVGEAASTPWHRVCAQYTSAWPLQPCLSGSRVYRSWKKAVTQLSSDPQVWNFPVISPPRPLLSTSTVSRPFRVYRATRLSYSLASKCRERDLDRDKSQGREKRSEVQKSSGRHVPESAGGKNSWASAERAAAQRRGRGEGSWPRNAS